MAPEASQVPRLKISLKPDISKKPHQLVPDVKGSYGIQPRLDVIRRPQISGTSLPTKYYRPGQKSPMTPEIPLSTYPYQQSRQTLGLKHQLLPSPRAEYRPQPGQLYPKYRPSPTLPLPNTRLHTLQRQDHRPSSQRLDNTLSPSQSRSTSQHYERQPGQNRLSVKWEYGTTQSQVRPSYRPEYRPASIYQSEQVDLATQPHHSTMQDENRLLSDYRLTRIAQTQQPHHPILTQHQRSEYQNSSVRPSYYSEPVATTTITTSFNQQWSKQPTISSPYEVTHSNNQTILGLYSAFLRIKILKKKSRKEIYDEI